MPVLSEQISLQPKSERRHCTVNQKNVRDTTESFEGVKATNNDAVLRHSAGTSGHGDGQYSNKSLRDDGDGKGDSVDGNLFVNMESGSAKYDDRETAGMSRSPKQTPEANVKLT